MLLEKPQNEAVETILTDCYNAGRNAVIQALFDYHKYYPWKDIMQFYTWYNEHAREYEMKFKVSDK